MDRQQVFTLSEIAQHKSKKDCWVVIDGRVLNVTKFLEEHPGGDDVLMESAGKDATKNFEDVGHSKAALNLLPRYQVGYLQGHKIQEAHENNDMASSKEWSTDNEMSAFVVKDSPIDKYTSYAEFLVPLLVTTSYLLYRYLAGHDS